MAHLNACMWEFSCRGSADTVLPQRVTEELHSLPPPALASMVRFAASNLACRLKFWKAEVMHLFRCAS